MDPSFQDFEFLDLTDVNDAELNHLQSVLYAPDPSIKYLELPWAEPTYDETEEEVAVADVDSAINEVPCPAPPSTLNPEVPPYPPNSSHIPVTMYQIMPSVYVNNVTANVSVHPYMGYHAVYQQPQQDHPPPRVGRGRPNKPNKPRDYRTNEEPTIQQQYPPYVPVHTYNTYYSAPPGHMQSAQHATGSPLYLPSAVPMYPPPNMGYSYHPHMYSSIDTSYTDSQKDPNQYHAEKMHGYEYQNNKEYHNEGDVYCPPDMYNNKDVYQEKGTTHYNNRGYVNNVRSGDRVMVERKDRNEVPKMDSTGVKVNSVPVIVNSSPNVESPVEMTFLNDSVIAAEEPIVIAKTNEIKTAPDGKFPVKLDGDVIYSDLKTDAQVFRPASKNKPIFEVKSKPIIIEEVVKPPLPVIENVIRPPVVPVPETVVEKPADPIVEPPIPTQTTETVNVIEYVASVQVEEVLPIPEQTSVPLEAPAGAGKSWASLFRKSAGAAEPDSNKLVARVEPFKTQDNAQDATQTAAEARRAQNQFDDPLLYRLGELLCKYELEHKAVSLQPRGITNRSNWCYINSTLQALMACPPFYNLMKSLQPFAQRSHRSPTPILDSIIQFVAEFVPLSTATRVNRKERSHRKDDGSLDVTCGPAFEPTYIYKMLNSIRSDTFKVEGRQEDAEEFLSCLLNALNDEMLEAIKLVTDNSADSSLVTNGDDAGNASQDDSDSEWRVMGPKNKGAVTRRSDFGRTPISDIFRGHLRSRVQRAGDQSTDNVQPFFTLQLDIEKAASVKEALELLVGRDQLEGVTCTKTNQEVEAWQQVTLEDLPLVLVLHLKWFDYKVDGCTKIVKSVEFPIELKVDPKLMSSTKKYGVKAKQYKLFAVVYHDGKEATKGHYVTDVYHVGYGGWVRYDDSTVRAVQEAQVLHPRTPRVPYLLYYRRGDTIGNQATGRS